MKRLTGAVAIALILGLGASLSAQDAKAEILAFFKKFDAAFNAKDLNALATLYHADVTIFEGSFVNNGWVDYRDHHLGPELKAFQNLQYAQSNIVIHPLGPNGAYVTADYSIKYTTGERSVDSGGIATHVLVKEGGAWKIRHSHTAARRRAPGGLFDAVR